MMQEESSSPYSTLVLPTLVLVHGWAMDRRFWQRMIQALQDEGIQNVITWDLGFFGDSSQAPSQAFPQGTSQATSQMSPQASSQATSQVFGSPAVLVGHSLGFGWGMAHPPQQGWQGLIAINALARFCRAKDWPWGVEPRVLRHMRRRFDEEPMVTLRAFLQRCGMDDSASEGKDDARITPANKDRLAKGLQWLEDWDGRDQLARMSTPRLFLTGGKDPILGDSRGDSKGWNNPDQLSQHQCCDHGGHMLPLTHPQWCARWIRVFLQKIGQS